MQLIVRAFPVLPGKEQIMRQFAREVQTTRAAEATDFYRRMGVARESWHLQETPHGSWVIGVTQIPEKPVEAAGRDYAASQHPFDRWFKDQVIAITGVDPEQAPLGPPTQCIFDTLTAGGAVGNPALGGT
jgi:hypothetical protein